MKSKCDHEWIKSKDKKSAGQEVCMWCGIAKVRSDRPVQRLKIPRADPKADRYTKR